MFRESYDFPDLPIPTHKEIVLRQLNTVIVLEFGSTKRKGTRIEIKKLRSEY